MKKTTLENLDISNALPFSFEPEEFKLGKWGNVDFYCKQDDILVLLEVEKGQKHPNTNVLKVWPFLEENPDQKVLLIQLIREENNAPKNRLLLCKHTGRKLMELFPGRFEYVYFNWHRQILPDLKSRIEEKINRLNFY
jgi:hypothetical protein